MDKIILEYYNFHSNNGGIPLHHLHFICTVTTHGSPLHHLVLDLISSALSNVTLRIVAEKGLIPNDLIVDIAAAGLCHQLCVSLPWDSWGCTYHLHPEGEFMSPCGVTCNCNSWVSGWVSWDEPLDLEWRVSHAW